MNAAQTWFQRAGLRARLLALVALAIVPAVGLMGFIALEERLEATSGAYDQLARIVRLAVSEQARQVDTAHHLLVGLSRLSEVTSLDRERCATTLRETFRQLPVYSSLGVARATGDVVCSTLPELGRASFADREWFRRVIVTRRMTTAVISKGRLTGQPIVAVALPIEDERGVHSVAFAGLNLTWLNQIAQEARLGRGATLTVVNGRGVVLVRDPDPGRWVGRDALADPHVRTVLTTRQGIVLGRGLDGVDRLYAFAPLVAAEGEDGAYLLVGRPIADVFARANHELLRNLLLLTLVAALAFAVAWSAGNALILNAVHGLLAAAKRLGEGDLTTRARLSGDYGELSELGRAFDQMADALAQRDAELSAAAAERQAMSARLQWAAIAEASSDAIIGIDAGDAIFSWNAGAEALFAHSATTAIGQPIAALVPPEWAAELAAGVERVRHGERVNDLELVGTRHDGIRVGVSCTLSPIHEPGSAISLIARDITERRRADERLRVQSAALEAAANGVLITAPDGTIEWVNPAFTAITGYAHDDAIGRTPRILKSGRYDTAFYAELWRTVSAGRVWQREMVNRRKDGTLYDEEQTITPVLDEHGVIAHFVAIKQDVTARRRAAEALRRSEEHFRSLIENALDMIFVMDRDGVLRYASPSVERVIGYRPEELVGQSAFARMHPDDVGAVRAVMAKSRGVPGFTASAEYRVTHKDGSWRTIEAVGRKLVENPGIVGIVINARDITERKRAEELQTQLQDQLVQTEKLAVMGNLLAGVAHELNNPLTVVIGHTTLLERAADGTAAGVRARKIGEAAKRCARIIKNFLALARQHAPERTPVDLRLLVRDTIEMMAYPLRVDDVEIVLDLADEVPLVPVDPYQIQQVIVNLVTNAHHAMRDVPRPRRLTLAVRVDGAARCATISVGDTGPGIRPEIQKRLFEPFFTTKPVGQGTGLGLSICKGIIESHGGRIDVAAASAHGAVFTVVVPLDTLRTTAPPAETNGAIVPCRVLVVDDEPDVVAVLTELLGADGHVVEGAGGGQEALAKIETGRFDAIVSDVRMPGVDGPALYRAVVERHPELSRRFMFVTGDTLDAVTARFLEETKVPSLAKPFSMDGMRRALARITRGGRTAVTPDVTGSTR